MKRYLKLLILLKIKTAIIAVFIYLKSNPFLSKKSYKLLLIIVYQVPVG